MTEPDTIAARGHERRGSALGAPRLPYAVRSVRAPERRWPHVPDSWDVVDGVFDELAEHPERDAASVLSPFAAHANAEVRLAVAQHLSTPASVVARLVTDADPMVRAAALAHPGSAVTPRTLRHAARSEHVAVRSAVAEHPSIPVVALKALVRDRDVRVARAAAANPRVRVKDLLDVPLTLVPADRLPEVVAASPVPVRTDDAGRAVGLLQEMAGTHLTRDALVAVGAVLA